ncbi:hypothetical protein J6590_057347 [Homalodisca vitripennis]|nr:hypothetical protein J6590_057347 [Homalodisca vitripennis]
MIRKKPARSPQSDRNNQRRQDLDQAVTSCARMKIQHLRREKMAVHVLHERSGLAHVLGYVDPATSAPKCCTYFPGSNQPLQKFLLQFLYPYDFLLSNSVLSHYSKHLRITIKFFG